MKDNLCNDCIFAEWDYDSVANAYCDQNSVKVVGEGNYVNECSSYQTKNIIKRIINFVKGNE
jgi:hypothetical protein